MNTIYNNLLTGAVKCITSKKVALKKRYPLFGEPHGDEKWTLEELNLADAVHVTLQEIVETRVTLHPTVLSNLNITFVPSKTHTPVADVDVAIVLTHIGEPEESVLNNLMRNCEFLRHVKLLQNIIMIIDKVPEEVASNIAVKYTIQRESFSTMVDPSICRFSFRKRTSKAPAAGLKEDFSREINVTGIYVPCTDDHTNAPTAIRRSVYSEPHVLLFFTDDADIAREIVRKDMSVLENIYADSPQGRMVKIAPDGKFEARLQSSKPLTDQTRLVVSVFYKKKTRADELLPWYEQAAMGYTPRLATIERDAIYINVQTYTTPMSGRFVQSVANDLNTKDCILNLKINKNKVRVAEVVEVMGDMDYIMDSLLSPTESMRINSFIEHLFMGLGMLKTSDGKPVDPDDTQTVLASCSPFNFLPYSCFTYGKMKMSQTHTEALFALALRCIGWTDEGFIAVCAKATSGDKLAQAKMSHFTNLFMRPVSLLPYRDDTKYDVVCDQFQCKFDRMGGDCDEGAVAVYYMLVALMRINVNIFDREAHRSWARYLTFFVPVIANMRIDQDQYINASHMTACLLPISGILANNKGPVLHPILIETTLCCTPLKPISEYGVGKSEESAVSRISELKTLVTEAGFHGSSIPVKTDTFYRRFVSFAANLDAYGFTSRMFVLNHEFNALLYDESVSRDFKIIEVAKNEPTKLIARSMSVVQSCPDIQPDSEKCMILEDVARLGAAWCKRIKDSIVKCEGDFKVSPDGFDTISFTLSLNATKDDIERAVAKTVELMPRVCKKCSRVDVELREDITCNYYILIICK